MEGSSRPSGAPVPVRFKGEDLLLDPMRVIDAGIIEQHLLTKRPNLLIAASQAARLLTNQAKREAAAIPKHAADREAQIKELLEESRAQADSLVNKAMAQTSKIGKISAEEYTEWCDSLCGVAFCFWLKFEGRYPGKFTLDEVTREFERLGDEALSNMIALRDQASGTDLVADSTGRTGATTTPTPAAPTTVVVPTGGESSGS
jgi:hypothetical protein